MKYPSSNYRMLSVVLIALGLFFIYLLKNKVDPSSNETAAIWLGYLLFFLGLGSFLYDEKIETQIDPIRKKITHWSRNILGEEKSEINFSSVQKVLVRRVGKPSNYTEFYFLLLKLKNQKTLATGLFFSDKAAAYDKASEIAELIGCENSEANLPNENLNGLNLILAFALGIAVYAIYYKYLVGAWCNAMWFGAAPVLIIGISTIAIFRILRRVNR